MMQSCAPVLARLFLRFLGLLLPPLLLTGCIALDSSAQQSVRPVQQTFRVSGHVLDSVSHKPVAGVYVNVGGQRNLFGGPQTDRHGRFVVSVGPTLGTRLTVHTVLYEGTAAISTLPASEVQLYVHRNTVALPETVCPGEGSDTLRMKPYASLATPGFGSELAFLVRPPAAQAPDTVRTLFLDVNRLGLDPDRWHGYYLLKAYCPNGPEQGPGTVTFLPVVNLCPSATTHPAGRRGLFAFDLRPYHIPVPAKGVYISLVSIVTEGWHESLENVAPYAPIGPLLHPSCALNEQSAWVYQYTQGWCPLPINETPALLYHDAVQVELVGPP